MTELKRHADEVTTWCIGGCYVKKELNYVFKPQITADNLPSILEKGIFYLNHKTVFIFLFKTILK